MEWLRKCNHCGNVVRHTNRNRFYISRKWNKKCEKCRTNGSANPFFGKRHSLLNRRNWSRKRTGKGNPMFGIGGMLGKKHSEDTIEKQKLARKKFWKSKGHECTDDFVLYRTEVSRFTRNQPIHLLENHEKRGKAGKSGAYHLDHIMSVWYGFTHSIPAETVARIENLRFIPWEENQKKWYHNE